MKETKNLLYPRDWLKYARKDWRRIYRMLKDNDIEAAAFFLQQALEKYIKAFLLQSGWTLKKIHDLDALLDDAVKYDPSLELFRKMCKRVSAYYLIERYPLPVASIPKHETIEKDLEEAKKFIKSMFPEELDI